MDDEVVVASKSILYATIWLDHNLKAAMGF